MMRTFFTFRDLSSLDIAGAHMVDIQPPGQEIVIVFSTKMPKTNEDPNMHFSKL